MTSINRRKFLEISAASLTGFFIPRITYGLDYPNALDERILFDEMVKNPSDKEKGQNVVDGVANRIFGSKIYDNVDRYIYDPDYSALNKTLEEKFRFRAQDPVYHNYFRNCLNFPSFYFDHVDFLSKSDLLKMYPEEEREFEAKKLLEKKDAPSIILNFTLEDDIRRRKLFYEGTIGCIIVKIITPGFASKSDCYFSKRIFEDWEYSESSWDAYSLIEPLKITLCQKSSVERLEATIVHEEKHAEHFHKGIIVSDKKIQRPKLFKNIRMEYVNLISELYSYSAETDYLKKLELKGNKEATIQLIHSTLKLNSDILKWEQELTFNRLPPYNFTKQENKFIKPHLSKINDVKKEIKKILEREGLIHRT